MDENLGYLSYNNSESIEWLKKRVFYLDKEIKEIREFLAKFTKEG